MSEEQVYRRRSAQRPSKMTFWIRRLVALLILAVIIAGVVWAVKGAISWRKAADASKQSAKEKATKEKLVNDPPKCKIADLDFSAEPKKESAEVGGKVDFVVKLQNKKETKPCTVDGSVAQIGIQIKTGDDIVWDSSKCHGKVGPQTLLLGTGMEYNTSLSWDGHVYSNCKAGNFAQAGSYRVSPVLGGKVLDSKNSFTLK